MNGLQYSVLVLIGFTLGVPGAAFGQTVPKPLSTSLGMVVFPAKGQTTQQQQLDLFKKGFAACLEPKGYTVK